MTFAELQKKRYSCRRYEEKPIPVEDVKECLAIAGHAPSSKNTQPWTVDYVSGAKLSELVEKYLAAFDAGEKPAPEYKYSPNPMPDLWMSRAREVGFALFAHKGIGREDKDKRMAHNRENFEFFKAPGVFFLSLPKDAERGNFLDAGMFLQGLMIALESKGFSSCPSFSAVSYPEILHSIFPGREDKLFVCGLVAGTEKPDHVNDFRTSRVPIEEWAQIWSD